MLVGSKETLTMDNTQLIGLSRQTALRHQMDVIANNLANLNTTGFKSQALMFEEYLMPVAEVSDENGIANDLSYVIDYASNRDFSSGGMVRTGNPLDIAIQGKGWLVVETPEGERFTRDGSLSRNADGELVTKSGLRVLGADGPIQIPADETGIVIAADGTVSTDKGVKGKFRVVGFADESKLENLGGNLFNGEGGQDLENPVVRQEMIERSNVRAITEITRMIEVTRAYQSVSTVLQQQAELQTTAIEKLGTVEA